MVDFESTLDFETGLDFDDDEDEDDFESGLDFESSLDFEEDSFIDKAKDFFTSEPTTETEIDQQDSIFPAVHIGKRRMLLSAKILIFLWTLTRRYMGISLPLHQ